METQGVESQNKPAFTETLGVKRGEARDQFLTMLITQMRFQDPLNPMDGTEFTAQLAQFSSLEQLFKVNESLSLVSDLQEQLTNIQATNYIGKDVVTRGDKLTLSQGLTSYAQYQLEGHAESGNLTVYDAYGGIVRIIELGQTDPGLYPIGWDGKDKDGNVLPDGEYQFQVNFYDENEDYVSSQTYNSGTVRGISFESGKALLDLGNAKVTIGDVLEVK